MKKARLFLMAIPIVAGGLYMRSLTSRRPQLIFKNMGGTDQLVFSNDGKTLLVGSVALNTKERRYDLMALDAVHDFTPRWKQRVGEGRWQFFASDTRIFGVCDEKCLDILDASTGKAQTQTVNLAGATPSPDGRWLTLVGSQTVVAKGPNRKPHYKAAILLVPTTQKSALSHRLSLPLKREMGQIISSKQGNCDSFAFSPDGSTLAVGVVRKLGVQLTATQIEFYDTHNWKHTQTWSDFRSSVSEDASHEDLQWSRNGRFLLSCTYHNLISEQHPPTQITISLWRNNNKQRLAVRTFSYEDGTPPFAALQLQNDGRVLALTNEGNLISSTLEALSTTGPALLSFPGEQITSFALTPDEHHIVVGTDKGQIYRQRLK